MLAFPLDIAVDGDRHLFTYVKQVHGNADTLVHVIVDQKQNISVKAVTFQQVKDFAERQQLFEIIAETAKLVRTLTTNWYSETGCVWCGNPRLFPDEAEMVSHKPDCLHFQAYKINELIKELSHES